MHFNNLKVKKMQSVGISSNNMTVKSIRKLSEIAEPTPPFPMTNQKSLSEYDFSPFCRQIQEIFFIQQRPKPMRSHVSMMRNVGPVLPE